MYRNFSLLIGLFLISCSKNEIANELVFFEEDKREEIFISSLFSKIETIVLETRDESLIGEISKVLYSNDRIFILDKRRANSIFIFDIKGTFINKIEGGYTGPGQLNFLDNMTIMNKKLIVYDSRQNKILFFDLSGEVIEEISLKAYDIYSLDLIAFEDQIIFFDFYSDPNILFSVKSLNEQFEINQENRFNEFKVISGRRLPYFSLIKDNDEFQVQIPGSDCYYIYDSKGKSHRKCFDFGSREIFNELEIVSFMDFYEKVSRKKYRILRGEYVDLEDYALFSTEKEKNLDLCLLDKKNNISFKIKLINDFNNLCPDIEFLPSYSVLPEELTLGFFPGDLKFTFAGTKKEKLLSNFLESKNISDTNNPVLFRLIR